MAQTRKLYGIILVCFLSVFTLYSQQPDLQKIDRKDLSKYVRKLSSPEFEGRATGTQGAKKTADYIARQFKELQLSPLRDEIYFQPFTLTRRYIGKSYLLTDRHKLTNFADYVASNNTDIPVEVEKTVVFGGMGTPEELDKIDVTDKIVLVFYQSLRNTIRLNDELQKRNAFGFMVAMPDDETRFAHHIRSTSYLKQTKIFNRDSRLNPSAFSSDRVFHPEFAVSNKSVLRIMKMNVEALKKTITTGEIQEVPHRKIRLMHQKITEDFEENNVIAHIKGSSSRAIVISAHYDHLGQKDNIYYPGADDNASGIAAMLELAEMFANRKELPYSLVFLAAAAEENGLLGSDYFVDNPVAGLTDSIILNINIDMIGRDDFQTAAGSKNQFYFTAKEVDTDVVEIFKKADAFFPNCDIIYQSPHVEPYFDFSDQFNFYAEGIPAISLFSGKHDDYHRTTDTHDKIDYNKLTERVQLIGKAIELIQQEYSGFN